jgi:hypothetical protein
LTALDAQLAAFHESAMSGKDGVVAVSLGDEEKVSLLVALGTLRLAIEDFLGEVPHAA